MCPLETNGTTRGPLATKPWPRTVTSCVQPLPEQIGPDIEGDTSREGGRDLHCHGWGNGKQAALLPRPHLLQAVDGRKGCGYVGGALEIEEALVVQGDHDVAPQQAER